MNSEGDDPHKLQNEDTANEETPITEPEHNIPLDEIVLETNEPKEMYFRSYAILVFWIFPFVFLSSITQVGALALTILFILGIYLDLSNSGLSNKIRSFLFLLVKILYGLKSEQKNNRMVRFWWFFSFGYLLVSLITGLFLYTVYFIIPLLLVLWKRKKVLRYLFILSFLPQADLVWLKSEDDRIEVVSKFDHLSSEEREYLAFNKPKFITNVIAWIFILLSPVMLVLQIIPISLFMERNLNILETVYDEIGVYVVVGLVAIVPYLVLNVRMFSGKKISTIINTRMAKFVVKALATTGLNAIPFFRGEYYLEKESDIVDMSSSTGFFEIFKKGRFFAIFVTPIAIVSLVLRYTVLNLPRSVIVNSNIRPVDFLNAFNEFALESRILLLTALILVPILISIILPLIWTISDAEIKRASWKHTDTEKQDEISEVEDLGKSLDKIFKLIIGISSITGLVSSISILVSTSSVTGYALSAMILIIVAILVIPGTLTMSYLYFSSGDHVRGVNYIRYFLSKENKISVGTISRNYKDETELKDPPSSVLINLN